MARATALHFPVYSVDEWSSNCFIYSLDIMLNTDPDTTKTKILEQPFKKLIVTKLFFFGWVGGH